MKRGTVTGEVKSILSELGVQYDFAYSDNYAKNRVGAKLVGVYLTDDQKEIVKNKMIESKQKLELIDNEIKLRGLMT